MEKNVIKACVFEDFYFNLKKKYLEGNGKKWLKCKFTNKKINIDHYFNIRIKFTNIENGEIKDSWMLIEGEFDILYLDYIYRKKSHIYQGINEQLEYVESYKLKVVPPASYSNKPIKGIGFSIYNIQMIDNNQFFVPSNNCIAECLNKFLPTSSLRIKKQLNKIINKIQIKQNYTKNDLVHDIKDMAINVLICKKDKYINLSTGNKVKLDEFNQYTYKNQHTIILVDMLDVYHAVICKQNIHQSYTCISKNINIKLKFEDDAKSEYIKTIKTI